MPLRTQQLVMNDSVENCPETFDFKPPFEILQQPSSPDCQPSIVWDLTTLDSWPPPHWVVISTRGPGVALCELCETPSAPESLHWPLLITLDIMTHAVSLSWPRHYLLTTVRAPWWPAWPWWPARSCSAWRAPLLSRWSITAALHWCPG